MSCRRRASRLSDIIQAFAFHQPRATSSRANLKAKIHTVSSQRRAGTLRSSPRSGHDLVAGMDRTHGSISTYNLRTDPEEPWLFRVLLGGSTSTFGLPLPPTDRFANPPAHVSGSTTPLPPTVPPGVPVAQGLEYYVRTRQGSTAPRPSVVVMPDYHNDEQTGGRPKNLTIPR